MIDAPQETKPVKPVNWTVVALGVVLALIVIVVMAVNLFEKPPPSDDGPSSYGQRAYDLVQQNCGVADPGSIQGVSESTAPDGAKVDVVSYPDGVTQVAFYGYSDPANGSAQTDPSIQITCPDGQQVTVAN